ncbi:MAG TPA: ThiF family adenylyltransferase [Nitrosomonas sp.]|nr:ThiF family adenylyltransferase [Nitrosomonas sp.]
MASEILYTRQEGIIPLKKIRPRRVTLIGAGAVGSFGALIVSKMGVGYIECWDDDGVNAHNLPNQFYRKKDIEYSKSDSLQDILCDFTDAIVVVHEQRYTSQNMEEIVIVATDSMSSRRNIWEQFQKKKNPKILIEARMGGELGMVYVIQKNPKTGKVPAKTAAFYESRLYRDEDVPELPCTERSIIYNVAGLATWICRALKGIIVGEKVPKEIIVNFTSWDSRALMFTE